MSKCRKRSPAKGKHAAKAPIEEWNSAAKTVKEQRSLSHFCWNFFLLLFAPLWKPVRKLFSFWPSDKKKEPSLSLETPDVASSSSALAAPCAASVAAKRASEEKTEGPAEGVLSLGAVNDKDPNLTGNSNEALPVGPEDIEAVISSTRRMNGGKVRVDRVGYQKKEEAEVNLFDRVHEIEVDEFKSERPGSDSGDWKKKHDDVKKERDDLKKKQEVFYKTVVLRQDFSNSEKTKEFEIMNIEIKKEVLKLLNRGREKNRKFKMVVHKTSFTKILRTMLFQRGNMALKSSFCRFNCRKDHRFPTFRNDGPEYKWWVRNFDPEILEKRLDILREAAKKWNPERDIFMVIELVTDLNSTLHPQTSEKDMVDIFRDATTICSLRSGGDGKI